MLINSEIDGQLLCLSFLCLLALVCTTGHMTLHYDVHQSLNTVKLRESN